MDKELLSYEEKLTGEIVRDIGAFDFSRLGVLIRLLTLRQELGVLENEYKQARAREGDIWGIRSENTDDETVQGELTEVQKKIDTLFWQIEANWDKRMLEMQNADWADRPGSPKYLLLTDVTRSPPREYFDAMRGYSVHWP